METDNTRRSFLRGGSLAAAGLIGAGAARANEKPDKAEKQEKHEHHHSVAVGSARDRGKLVPGQRKPGSTPVPVVTPDLDKLPYKLVGKVKEFHLEARHTRREFLPGAWMDVWGYNGSMPGPTIEAVEGDRVRIIVHNKLPESTTMHWHGLEVPNRLDGVHGVTQDPIRPGQSWTYEFDLHQNGTYFYHSHGPMQEGMGMAGMFLIHPRQAYEPIVDHDFALMIQEWAILPNATIPNTTSMEFNWFTLNGRSAPYVTPLLVKLGSRVRIRLVNMSPIDHHPMHLHGHSFWITGTEAGRIPESAWIPSNNVLVAVAQAREIEFIANNPGDWLLHCHMFHHMMNHMTVMVGPMSSHMRGMPAGADTQSGMGMSQRGHALSEEHGPSMGRGMGEQTSNDRSVPTGPHGGHGGHGGEEAASRVPGYPQDMMDMHGMYTEAQVRKLEKPETRGMRKMWYMGVEALHTIVRVLPAELYEKVVSGKGEVAPGASVPGSMGGMPGHKH